MGVLLIVVGLCGRHRLELRHDARMSTKHLGNGRTCSMLLFVLPGLGVMG
jgi:hypothetical protein